MSVIGTYNGADIIALPTSPGLKQLQVDFNDTDVMDVSPFTGASQVQSWPGADFWSAELTLPQLNKTQTAEWTAFLGELRGRSNVFYLGHPMYRQPSGSVEGTPVVNGVNSAMATMLNTKGWKPSTFRLLLPGDYLQLGVRLHLVLNQVDSDSSGNAAIKLFPSIREATTDGDAIILNKPQGLWRLLDNKRSVLTTETRLSGVSLKLLEAR